MDLTLPLLVLRAYGSTSHFKLRRRGSPDARAWPTFGTSWFVKSRSGNSAGEPALGRSGPSVETTKSGAGDRLMWSTTFSVMR